MSLADDHATNLATAVRLAQSLPGPDLPGWTFRPPDDTSWAPRLVHDDGTSVMIRISGGRLRLTHVLPVGAVIDRTATPEITVAVDTPRARIVSHFTRRLAAPARERHRQATAALARDEQYAAARRQAREDIRRAVPADWADEPWPMHPHDLRLRAPAGASTRGWIRVEGPDGIDLHLESLNTALATRLLAALLTPPDADRGDDPCIDDAGPRG